MNKLYEREAVGCRLVEVNPATTWLTVPVIYEED